MSRKKNILLASTCIVLGMALAGPAAHAAEEILTAVRHIRQRNAHSFFIRSPPHSHASVCRAGIRQ